MALAGFLNASLCLNWRVILLLIGKSLHLPNTIRWLRLIKFIPCWQEYGRDCHLLVSVWNAILCWLPPKNAKPNESITEWRYFKDHDNLESFAFCSDFHGFVVFAVLIHPCWSIILFGFNSLGSDICNPGELVCFSNCFNRRRFSMLSHWSSLFVKKRFNQAVNENLV